MDRNTLARLRERRAELMQKLEDMLERGKRDGGLSENDQAAYDRIEARFDALTEEIKEGEEQLQADLGPVRDARAADGRPVENPAADRRPQLTLSPEARMVDWTAERGGSNFTADDAEQFSLGAAVRGMVRGDWRGSELERRALSEGTDALGGALVPELLAASTIDRLRNASRIFEAGAQVAPMGSDQVSVPKLTGAVVPGWRAENAPVAESDPSFGRVVLQARTLAVLTNLSWELVEDLTPQGAQLIENELVNAISLELDRACLYGDGTAQQPVGVKNQAGVTIEAIAADGATPADYGAFIKAAFALRRSNVKPNAYIYSERTAETVAGFAATDGQPLLPPPAISDVLHLPTGQVRDDNDQGTTLGAASDLFTGDFRRLIVGIRPQLGVRVVSNGTASMDTMSVQVVAYIRADVQLSHSEGFHVTTGLLA